MKSKQDPKQSKISRHQNAKQKFRFFERSISTKSLNNKPDIVPVPGQFAIIGNKKSVKQGTQLPSIKMQHGTSRQKLQQDSLKFTTNLKLITRQRSPSRVSEVLNEAVNKKVTEQTSLKRIPRSSSSTNIRPNTAAISMQLANDLEGKDNLQQSRAIMNAVEYDKKYYIKKQLNQGNSFMVKSKSGIPKHAYGFKSIRLTQDQNQRKLKLQTEHENRPGRKFSRIPTETRQIQPANQEQIVVDTETQKIPNFLPVQYYMIDDLKPQELIQKFSMGNDYMVGFSKWQDVDGNFEWKKCRIIGYVKDRQRWEIQWLHNGKKKLVGRNNLYFENQDYNHFQQILKKAQNFRKKSQIYMKYNWLIDNMKTLTHQIQQKQLNKIIKLLGKFVPAQTQKINLIEDKTDFTEGKKNVEKLALQLIKQIRAKYIRANHMIQFNASLPYSLKYKKQFRGYLPQTYFAPNSTNSKFTLSKKHELHSQKQIYSKKTILQSNELDLLEKSTQVYCSQEKKKIFQQGKKRFIKHTPLTSLMKIQIIEYLNKSQYGIKTQRIPSAYDISYNKDQVELPQNELKYFSFYKHKTYEMNDVLKRFQGSLFDSITKMNSIVCEVEFFVAKELDPIYLDRKLFGNDNFDEMIDNYRKFLLTVNMRIENMGRQILLGMLKQLTQLLKTSDQLLKEKQEKEILNKLKKQKTILREMKLKVTLQLKNQHLQSNPTKEEVITMLSQFSNKLLNDFSELSCIRKSYVQQLRPENRMKICQSLQQDQKGQKIWITHKVISQKRQQLQKVIEQCGQIYGNFSNIIKRVVDKVTTLQGEIKKKNWKKCSFNEIQQIQKAINEIRIEIEQIKLLSVNSNLVYKSSLRKAQTQNQDKKKSQSAQKDKRQSILNRKQAMLEPQRNNLMQKLQQMEKDHRFVNVGVFLFDIEQLMQQIQQRVSELQKQLSRLLIEKIYRESQKLEKQIQTIKQKIQHEPSNIKEMINLEHYINQEAPLQLSKTISRILQIQTKLTLIQTCSIDYKDFYEIHKVMLKPLKIRYLMTQKLNLIESEYRKKFGQQLLKQVSDLTLEMKQIEEKFLLSTNITTIEEMNTSFMAFTKLKERIEKALSKSTQVNEYESAMKWINTSFEKLFQIRDQFMPYYQLITLQKNYHFNINVQLTEPLHTIDAKKITQDVNNAYQQLFILQNDTFATNPIILQIVKSVANSYKKFKQKLPLIQIIRNPDLRQRHWTSIKQLTGFNDILNEKITFSELQKRDIKKFEKKLIEISHIATRQLIYQKKLNKMKKQWKQLKIQTKIIYFSVQESALTENNNFATSNEIRIINNLDEIKTKTQNDIYQIQEILASYFIKFLQKDVLLWRNNNLYKMYEFIEIWKALEKQFIPLWKMFSRPFVKNQASNQFEKFKVLEKNWKNLTQTIEQQPNVIELLQTKINESLKYTVELNDELKKIVSEFFEKKKRKYPRFGSLSQDQLIALYSNSIQEKDIFDQAVRKCLQGVKGVVRNNQKRITMVKTHLDEEIFFSKVHDNEQDDLSPDKIIEDIEKKIKRSLRSCIDQIGQKSAKILQIVLFHQRIIFTQQIESQLLDIEESKGIKEEYLDALLQLKSKIIKALFQSHKSKQDQISRGRNIIKIQSQLNQLINHIEIAEWLYRKNVTETFDFEWISQIRTYHISGSYFIQCGLNKTQYGFQITDQPNYIVQKHSLRTFCHLSMTTMERMFSILSGKVGEGKISALHYLANIHGRNELVLNCHQAISYDNIIDSFRMCANGIWIVLNNINFLTPQVLSVFAQALQTIWFNYPTQKSKGYLVLGDTNVVFTTHEINLFATINTNKNNFTECGRISKKLSTFFRNYSVPSLDVKYILECRLILQGFDCLDTYRFYKMIELIETECEIFYQNQKQQGQQIYGSLSFSKLNFIQKVVKYANQLKEKYTAKNTEDFILLQQGLQKAISDITLNLDQLKEQIFSKLTNYFNFMPEKQQIPLNKSIIVNRKDSENDQELKAKIKKLFTEKKLYFSINLIEKYLNIIKTLKQKHSVILLGDCSTGKSQLINLLTQNKIKQMKFHPLITEHPQQAFKFDYIDDFNIELSYLHPNAYSLTELFGDFNKNGIVNSLIKISYEKLDREKMFDKKNQKRFNQEDGNTHYQPFKNVGLVFDSQIGPWIEPLLPLIKSSNTYIQPNGKTVLIEHPLKLIFQCRDLSSVSPSIILATNIVHLESNSIKWQHMFSQYLRKNFNQQRLKHKVFLDYCESLITFILEPVLEFFKSSVSSFHAKNVVKGRTNENSSGQESLLMGIIYKSFLKNESNFVPFILNLFIALVESHFVFHQQRQTGERINRHKKSVFSSLLTQQSNQSEDVFMAILDDKNRSVIFGQFIMAITWSLGLMMPEESKKTFSRHFKYVIKRAIQLNIKGIQKEFIPKDEEDIYQLCLFNNKWISWEDVMIQNSKKPNQLSNAHFTKSNRDSVPMKTKIKYTFLFDKYCQNKQPFFLIGKNSTGKNSLMLSFFSKLHVQSYNTMFLTCTPQSTHQHAKIELRREIKKQKYSHAFSGFVNGKFTLFYLCDMNLPMKKNQNQISLNEFVNQYVKSQGWYLNSSSEFYRFKNVVFCGTLNSNLGFNEHILKSINPIPYVQCETDLRLTLFSILNGNQLIGPFGQKIVKLMMNLHQVVGREFKNKTCGKLISYRDLSQIAQNLSFKVTDRLIASIQNTDSLKNLQTGAINEEFEKKCRNKILQCWIMQTQQKYRQIMGKYFQQQKIYYFINNVLMEEQRLRYKTVLSSKESLFSNITYYLSRIFIQDKSASRRSKITKSFLLPYSYKVYEGLSSIKEEIQNIEKYIEKTSNNLQTTQINQKKYSFAKEIELALSAKRDPMSVSSYLKSMQCILDYFLDEKSRLIFMVNQSEKIIKKQTYLNPNSTVKQIFNFGLKNQKQQKFTETQQKTMTELERLFRFVTNINKSHVVTFQHPEKPNQVATQWRLFISEFFELINSPFSSNLHDYYVVYLNDIKNSQEFILQEFLTLIRTGVLKVLEQYIASEDLDSEQLTRNQTVSNSNKNEYQGLNDSRTEQEEPEQMTSLIYDVTEKAKIEEEKKKSKEKRKKGAAQLMRQKVLRRIKFVIEIDEQKMQKLKDNYSILFEKCHIIWSSHLIPSSQALIKTGNSQKQLSSVEGSLRSLGSQEIKQQTIEIEDGINQQDQEMSLEKLYNDHKQSLNQSIYYNDIKAVYLSLMTDIKSKQEQQRIQNDINLQNNYEFLQFLNLYQNIFKGVQFILNQKINAVNKQLQYFITVSQTLLPYIANLITQRYNILQSKQLQLAQSAQNIQKVQEQNQKYLAQFLNAQKSIAIQENQFREANQAYRQTIKKEEKNFFFVQSSFIDFLKTAKDKKILLTNQMKSYLQIFGLVINKKIKPEESMVKQIIKDIGALKISKKVTNLLVEVPIGQKLGEKQTIIGQKAIGKLKQFVTKNLMSDFTKLSSIQEEYSFSKDKIKQGSFSENLLQLLKEYLIFLLIFYNKSQEEIVKSMYKKCSKMLKELTKSKDQFQKSQKNKNYENIITHLQELKKHKLILLQQYDHQNKYIQNLRSINQKALQLNCLLISGDIDQGILAVKSSFETLKNIQSPERIQNLIIERMKTFYQKQMDSLSSINSCKEVISLIIAIKFEINQLQRQNPDSSVLSKNLSKQVIQSLQPVKILQWERLFPEMNHKLQQSDKNQRINIINYFFNDFDIKKALSLINGVVFVSKSYEQKLISKSQSKRLIKYSTSLTSQNIINAFKGNENKREQTPSLFNKTIFLSDFTSFQQAKEFLTMISLDKSLIEFLSVQYKIIIFLDEPIISQIDIFDRQKLMFQFSRFSIQFMQLDKKKSQSQHELLHLLEEKLQDELCFDKKQNQTKILNHWKELKQSQLENLQQTNLLIQNFNLLGIFQHLKSKQIQFQKPKQQQNTSFVSVQTQKTALTSINKKQPLWFKDFEDHICEMKRIFLQYANINLELSMMPNFPNTKRKSSTFINKLLKYLARVYEGIEILKSEGLILNHYSAERYLYLLTEIVRREKQLQKMQSNQTKFFKNIKNKLFQNFLIGENNRKMFFGLIFALSGQQSLNGEDFQKLIKTIIRVYFYSFKLRLFDKQIRKKTGNFNDSEVKMERQTAFIVNSVILKAKSNENQKNQEEKKELSSFFESMLQQLQSSFLVFKDLKINLKKRLNTWVKFFLQIQYKFKNSALQTLPEPYNDINRVYFGIFAAFICPSKLQNWIDVHLQEQDLMSVSEYEVMSNESRILSLNTKLNVKQSAIIGDEVLNSLCSLATRTKKQIKLYSKLDIKSKQVSIDNDLSASKPASRKQISLLPEITFFAERQISQQIIEEIKNCMKNSAWLVIDVNSLIKHNQLKTDEFSNLQILLKIIDSLTNPKDKSQNQNNVNSHHQQKTSPSNSQNNLSLFDYSKNDFNPASFANYDYHVFFIVPQELKKQIFQKTNLSKNNQRFVMEIRQENNFSKLLSINKNYHKELLSSKKMIKDYETVTPLICETIYYGLEIVQEVFKNVTSFKIRLQDEKISQNGVGFDNFKEAVDKFLKIIMIIMQDSQIFNETLLQSAKTSHKKIPLPIANQTQNNIDPVRPKKQNARKKTIKLMLKQTISKNIQKDHIIEKDQIRTQKDHQVKEDHNRSKLSSNKSLQSKKSFNETKKSFNQLESPQQKKVRILQVLKLIFTYLSGSFDQKEVFVADFKKFLNQYFKNKEDPSYETCQKAKKIQKVISNLSLNKIYGSSKPTLQELVEILVSADVINSKSSQQIVNKKITNQFFSQGSSKKQNKLINFKLVLERLLQLKQDTIMSQKLSNMIQILVKQKKQLQNTIIEIKKQLYPVLQGTQSGLQTISSSQFNFSSLTENLTLQEMRKKLNVNNQMVKKQQKKQHEILSKRSLNEFSLKVYVNLCQKVDQKIDKLKNLKNIFLLGSINYQLVMEWWIRQDENSLGSQVVDLFCSTENIREQCDTRQLNRLRDFVRDPTNLLIPRFSDSSNDMMPVISLDLISQVRNFHEFIYQLQCVFIEVNRLKNPRIKLHYIIEENHSFQSLKQNKSKEKQQPLKSQRKQKKLTESRICLDKNENKWFKICGFRDFEMVGLRWNQKESQKYKHKEIVFEEVADEKNEQETYHDSNLVLVLCFQCLNEGTLNENKNDKNGQNVIKKNENDESFSEDSSQDDSQNQSDENIVIQKNKEFKEMKVPFFKRQFSQINEHNRDLKVIAEQRIGHVLINVKNRPTTISQKQKPKRTPFIIY